MSLTDNYSFRSGKVLLVCCGNVSAAYVFFQHETKPFSDVTFDFSICETKTCFSSRFCKSNMSLL